MIVFIVSASIVVVGSVLAVITWRRHGDAIKKWTNDAGWWLRGVRVGLMGFGHWHHHRVGAGGVATRESKTARNCAAHFGNATRNRAERFNPHHDRGVGCHPFPDRRRAQP